MRIKSLSGQTKDLICGCARGLAATGRDLFADHPRQGGDKTAPKATAEVMFGAVHIVARRIMPSPTSVQVALATEKTIILARNIWGPFRRLAAIWHGRALHGCT